MSRLLIAIGCDKYVSSELPSLHGAETDAKSIFTALVSPAFGDYDPARSRLLLSPTVAEVREVINEVLYAPSSPSVFTFYYAGHGLTSNGACFICCSDTDLLKLSLTAISASFLFGTVAERQPLQANIILDACESGGIGFDLSGLLKPEIMGSRNSPAISLFAAATSRESALEVSGAGVATSELLEYITGKKQSQTIRPYLDLLEVGRQASHTLSQRTKFQTPVVWGLHLHGLSTFVRNPHYAEISGVPQLLYGADALEISQDTRQEIWKLYLDFDREVETTKLVEMINRVHSKTPVNSKSFAAFVQGLAAAFTEKARNSISYFASTELLGCFVLTLSNLKEVDKHIESAQSALIEQLSEDLTVALRNTLEVTRGTPYGLLSKGGGLSDLYVLPLRLSKILGWAGLNVLLNKQFSNSETKAAEILHDLSCEISEQYSGALVTVSDAQAPYLFLYLCAAVLSGQQESAEKMWSSITWSFFDRKGYICRPDCTGEDSFAYLYALSTATMSGSETYLAKPTNMMSVIMWGSRLLGVENLVDPFMRQLDHHSFNIFIPADHRDSGMPLIRDGVNVTNAIGHSVWRVQDFLGEWSKHCQPLIDADLSLQGSSTFISSAIGSMLMPDRVCWAILKTGGPLQALLPAKLNGTQTEN